MATLQWDFDKQEPIKGEEKKKPIGEWPKEDERCVVCGGAIGHVLFNQPDSSSTSHLTHSAWLASNFDEDTDIEWVGYSCEDCFEDIKELLEIDE